MTEIQHRTDVGSVILGLLNGLKHTPQTIGPLLDIAPEELAKVIRGEAELTTEMESILTSVTGINQRDFYPAEARHLFPAINDTNDGVVIFRKEDTIKSQRTLRRGPEKTPYYIYADMAMSNLSSFRPEWIKQLYIHDGEKADDLPDWAFNKGHFEHQVTYFIGPVNFHWKDKEGKKYVCRMNTGDTNYIVPFVPHSFTTRVKGEGLILAVTYGGAISNQEFRHSLSLLDIEEYIGNTKKRLPVLPSKFKDFGGGVEIAKRFDAKTCEQEFRLQSATLINPDGQPDTKVTELKLQAHSVGSYNCFSDCWGYNLGNSNVLISWKGHEDFLNPGDSFLVESEVPHIFSNLGHVESKLLLVDIHSQSGDPYTEMALIEKYVGEAGLRRVHTETTRWY